jgi:GTP cyclohydrolase I
MQTILETHSLANASPQELMREMLLRLGEDPERDGLRNTPERMERSMRYLTKGYEAFHVPLTAPGSSSPRSGNWCMRALSAAQHVG